jgi:hypothetical protein
MSDGKHRVRAAIKFNVTRPGQGGGMQAEICLHDVFDNRELRANQRTRVLNSDGSVIPSLPGANRMPFITIAGKTRPAVGLLAPPPLVEVSDEDRKMGAVAA